ncbi:copper resistance protein CopC [Rhizobium sp. ARZ01]|uniref:copper resistance CopC/CopD family protein n=1 Tax=Rhizobium sp. ARZ01 TaxID=2769313 RepID=UPI0017825139|nr:copper resistance CopC/CopD family protein [Rhizobium sp. ARZ01]MBD9373540.1 copper resistance protein CopC [Rhizobium sp. ARZ01]
MAVLALLFLATTALAHASLTASEPRDGAVIATAPAKFALSFSEPVSPLALRLIEPDGSPVELERFKLRDRTVEIELPPDLSAGTHVLTWRVVSEDGHPVGGSVVFSVGAPSKSAPDAATVDWTVRAAIWVSRIAMYAGLFFGIGGVFAANWLLRDARVARRFNAAMLGTGLVGTALSAGLQGLDALGRPLPYLLDPLVWSTGLSTSFGRTVLAMTVALVLAAFSLHPRLARGTSLLALVTGSLALSLSGHASAAEPQWLMRPSVFLHALAISIWVGALVPLAKALHAGHPAGAKALHRFSALIPSVVSILVVAGIALAVVQVGGLPALFSTAYGYALLVKLALAMLLFALAAFNRWALTGHAEAGDKSAVRALVRSITAEILLVLMVLGVAAAWRFTPPPRTLAIAAAQPASVHLHGSRAMAEVTIARGQAEAAEASAFVMGADFAPLDAKEVTFVFANPSVGIEQIKRKARKLPNGSWDVSDLLLPLPGVWRIRLDILISDFEIERIESEIDIK